MNASPDRYAVCGNPVAHSKSPQIHAWFAKTTGQSMDYGRLFIPEGQFQPTVERFFSEGGRGLNVTLPCKGEAFAWLGERRCDASAVQAAAVNTIRWDGQQAMGFNTDGIGLVRDLAYHRIEITGRRVLILGAGGAVRGVLPALMAVRPSSLGIANRTRHRAEALAHEFGRSVDCPIEALELSELGEGFDVVINATSAAFSSGARPDVKPEVVRHSDCYDMVYGDNAYFHLWARELTTERSVDGLGMLIEQAAEAFWLWRGVRPETAELRTFLRQS